MHNTLSVTLSRLSLAALLGLSLNPAAFAQTIKPGLWESTGKMEGNAEMDQAMAQVQKQMAAMPPAQRKQMEEMMAKQGVQMKMGGSGVPTTRICVSKEMADQSMVMQHDQGCQHSYGPRIGNTQKFSFTCTKPPSKGEGTVTFKGNDAYDSIIKVTSERNGKPETVTISGSSKFISADCGGLKPPPMMAVKK
jgi:hypothetical protein